MPIGLAPPLAFSLARSVLLGVLGITATTTNPSATTTPPSVSSSMVRPGLTVTSMSLTAALPLLGVGLLSLLLSLCFCCYLWKLKRDAHSERGYSQLKYSPRSKKMKNDMCPVCLEEFEQAEKLSVSRCRHGFHTKCLQQWLDQHNTCPMCKATVATGQAGERTGLITSDV